MTQAYTVKVVGFTSTERTVLKSMFALTARRAPNLSEIRVDSDDLPDIHLVDADDPSAIRQIQKLSGEECTRAILIGSHDPKIGATVLPRPVRWTKLLTAFDNLIELKLADHKKAEPTGAVPSEGVLVVDDNGTVREFMRAKLAPYGLGVEFAESGEHALRLFEGRKYSCVFLDAIMAGLDGYQICKLLKARRGIETAVVMLTGRGSAFDKIRGAMAGCDAYLAKPVDEEKLLETVGRFITQRAPLVQA